MAFQNLFLDPGNTIVVTAAGAGSSPVAIQRGIRYRIVSDVDCFIQFGATAVANAGVYLPAKTELYWIFGMDDIQGTDPLVAVYMSGAGHAFFTPAHWMPTFK